MIRDLGEEPGGAVVEADVCVVGSGAAGLSLATRLARSKLRVAVLEAGGLESDEATQALYRGENVGLPRHPLETTRLRYFGGSTNHWTGLCAPLQPSDFRARAWIPRSGWPIGPDDLAPHYRDAIELCGLDAGVLELDLASALGRTPPPISAHKLPSLLLHYAPRPRFAGAYGRALCEAENVEVVLHANVTRVQANAEASRVEHVAFRTLDGRSGRARARAYVLCCGGIENARLLLLSDDVERGGLGNRRDVVGRFFMDHPFVRTGEIVQTGGVALDAVYPDFERDGRRYRPAFALGESLQRAHELAGCAAYLWRSDDQRSDATRAARRLLDASQSGRLPDDLAHDVAAVAGDLGGLYDDVLGDAPAAPQPARLEILCLLDQTPDPESRVSLSRERDTLGLRRVQVDWRVGDRERRTLELTTETIAAELGRLGLGRVRLAHWLAEHEGFEPAPMDYNHHMGTTRMSDDPATGVVDARCRVHGIDNLYLAGSSVFPTGGATPPTLTILALALRLAEHLRGALA